MPLGHGLRQPQAAKLQNKGLPEDIKRKSVPLGQRQTSAEDFTPFLHNSRTESCLGTTEGSDDVKPRRYWGQESQRLTPKLMGKKGSQEPN